MRGVAEKAAWCLNRKSQSPQDGVAAVRAPGSGRVLQFLAQYLAQRADGYGHLRAGGAALVNNPEGWGLLAYGDRGDALLGKTRSPGYGDKSRSVWDGSKKAANGYEWRKVA